MNMSDRGFNTEYMQQAPTVDQLNEIVGDTILEFGAPWCAHCKAASPAIETSLNEHTELSHIRIYDGKGKVLGRKFQVKRWPTLILLRDGKEVARLVRPLTPTQVRQFIARG